VTRQAVFVMWWNYRRDVGRFVRLAADGAIVHVLDVGRTVLVLSGNRETKPVAS